MTGCSSGGLLPTPLPMSLVNIFSKLAMMDDSILARSSSVAICEGFATSLLEAEAFLKAAAAASEEDCSSANAGIVADTPAGSPSSPTWASMALQAVKSGTRANLDLITNESARDGNLD